MDPEEAFDKLESLIEWHGDGSVPRTRWQRWQCGAAHEMRGRPLGAGRQGQASNRLKLHRSRAGVVSVEEKARLDLVR